VTADSITFSLAGGASPYYLVVRGPVDFQQTYFQPGTYILSGLIPGNYLLTITDSQGRVVRERVTIASQTEPLAISELNVNNVSGNNVCDGSIRIQAKGGRPPYQYVLNGTVRNSTGTFANLCSDSYQVTVVDQRGVQVSETVIVGVICFTRDSYVETDQGPVRVDRLKPWHTVRKQPVRLVCSGTVPPGSDLIEVSPGAIKPGVPNRPLVLTPNHRVFHAGRFVQAGQLARVTGSRQVKTIKTRQKTEVFNVLLPNYTTMGVNGLEIESLHPKSTVARNYQRGLLK
jgi:hypothetical protein